MEWYNSTGSMIRWFIKDIRNKKIKEVAEELGINEKTFSAQLINDTLSAETLFKLAAYLDIDLNWMMYVLGYYGEVSVIDRETIPRMGFEFREI